jgi:hypothetical protein
MRRDGGKLNRHGAEGGEGDDAQSAAGLHALGPRVKATEKGVVVHFEIGFSGSRVSMNIISKNSASAPPRITAQIYAFTYVPNTVAG